MTTPRPTGEFAPTLLQHHARVGLWIVFATLVLYVIADATSAADPAVLRTLHPIRLFELAALALAARLNARIRRDRPRIVVLLVYGTLVCACAALTGYVRGDPHTPAVATITLALGAATILPWGALAQTLCAATVGGTLLLAAVLTGDAVTASPHLVAATAVALLTSIYVAGTLDRHRRERHRAERELRRSEHWFRSLIENGSDVIAIVGADGRIRYTSPSVRRLLGYGPVELLGRRALDLVAPEDAPRIARRIADTVTRTFDLACRCRHRNGSWRDVEATTCDRRQDEIGGYVIALRDVTDRRRTEAELDRLFRLSYDILAVGDRGVFVRANPAWERTLGFAPDELTGRNVLDFVHPEDRAAMSAGIARVTAGELCVSFENRMIRKDGAVRWIEWNATPSGKGLVYAAGRDVTDRKRAQAAREQDAGASEGLARAGHELIAVLETPALLSRLCAIAVDVLRAEHGTSWLWNEQRRAYVPVASHGAVASDLAEIRVGAEELGPLLDLFAHQDVALIRDDAPLPASIRDLRRRNGVTLSVCFPLRHGNTVVGVQTVNYRGRTDRLTAAEEHTARGLAQLATMALSNAHLIERLEEASRLKSEFVATMSHELRTPLNVIIGYTEVLADEVTSADHLEFLRHIRCASVDLLELVEATLDVNRFAAGNDPPQLEAVRVAEIWSDLQTEYTATPRDVALEWRPLADAGLTTDRRKLEQILKTLIGNALKFTPAGRVVVAYDEEPDAAVFHVRDTGIGIAAEHLPYIFDMFRQVDGSMTRSHGGVGIGLYLARKLVEQLGGTIGVESTPGEGSTFTVRLPQQPRNGAARSTAVTDASRAAAALATSDAAVAPCHAPGALDSCNAAVLGFCPAATVLGSCSDAAAAGSCALLAA